MTIVITGKQIELGDSLRATLQTEIETIVTRHLDGPIEAHVTVTKDAHHHFKTDIQIHVGKSFEVHCSGGDNDVHRSVNHALDKLSTQLKRYKTRLIEKRRHKDSHVQIAEKVQKFIIQTQAEDTHDDNPVIIAEMDSDILTLSVGDAVMKMDLAGLPVLLFRNASNNQLNVVYKRSDGNIGWVDPSLKAK